MDRARTLRLIGTIVMISGVALAAAVYAIQARSASLDEAASGFSRGQEHQMKALMGPLAVAMSGWADALTSPAGEAIMIVGFAAFVGYMCFRHARFADEEDGTV